MDTSKNIIKHIALKRPSKILLYVLIANTIFAANHNWIIKPVNGVVFWIVSSISIIMVMYWYYVYYIYYTSKSIKNITIYKDDNIVLNCCAVQNWDTKSHDYATSRYIIKIEVKGNRMRLYEKGKPDYIAKIYKRTMKDKNDWEWLINYFDKV